MWNANKYLITAALPYANGPLHIGHLAGAYLPADVFVRFLKANGKDVVFVCGSDEHGAAITLRAKKEGLSPQQIVDKYHTSIENTFKDLGVKFDIYHRTSSELHHETAAAFFKTLHSKGVFEKMESEQFFDEEHQQFLADRYIKGTCPKCGHDAAYGDQCEKCGSTLSPNELINPVSVLSGKAPIIKRTWHWYLPMQNHESWLREWLTNGVLDGKNHHNPADWKKNVLGQCMSWIDTGLQSRAMTRDLDWGVKVPLEGEEGKVLYVWLDAPIGYISATKQWALDNNKNWEEYWQDENTQLVHFIGKDNIVFHCIIFPIILKAHGLYNLPVNVPANEFLNLEGQKISTSRNWAVWVHEYLEDFKGKQDELRYVLISIAPEQKDSEFTWSDYQARVNNELVAIYGNFVNRCLVLTQKYYEGIMPDFSWTEAEKEIWNQALKIKDQVAQSLYQYKLREALADAMNIARLGNKFLADTEPWKLIKIDPERVKGILHLSVQLTALLADTFAPFLPFSSEKIAQMLALHKLQRAADGFYHIPRGHVLGEVSLLFEKITDEQISHQLEKLKNSSAATSAPAYAPSLPEVQYDDFAKIDLRVGLVTDAEKVKNADKLLQLSVDLGYEKRTVVSGIAKFYTPESIVGKKVVLVANLAPRKLRGIESKGMILMAEDDKGNLKMIAPEDEARPGDIVK